MTLEERIALSVYYFNGNNLFGPAHQQNDPYWLGNGSAWLNPYNWGLETAKGIVVGQGVPGGSDTVVFRGATETGDPWMVYDGHTDSNGNYDHGVKTGGGSVTAREDQAAGTLNLDRNWGGTINLTDTGLHTLSVTQGGRWQSGAIFGNIINTGNLLIAPDANGTVSSSLGVLTNTGTITQTAGNFQLGYETGVVPYAGTMENKGKYSITGGRLTRASNAGSWFQNDGILTGSGGSVEAPTITSKSGTIESTGLFSLPGPQTIDGGTVRATSNSTLTFNSTGVFPLYGTSTWNGAVTVGGGGLVQVVGDGEMDLNQATFTVAADTRFEIDHNSTPIHGNATIPVGSTLTVRRGSFQSGILTVAGTLSFPGAATPSQPVLLSGGQISIAPGGTLQLGGLSIGGFQGSRPDILNAGRINGTGFYAGWVSTTPGGFVEANGGELTFPGRFDVEGGSVQATSGSTLNIATNPSFPTYGSSNWKGAIAVGGGGMVELTGDGVATLDNAKFSIAADTSFEINGNNGPTLNGTGSVDAGILTIRRGFLTGAHLTNNAIVVFAGKQSNGNDNRLNGGTVVTNHGTLIVDSPGVQLGGYFGGSGNISNSENGLIEFRQSSSLISNDGSLVVNRGTVRVDAGVGSVYTDVGFDNIGGTIDVQSGSLTLANNHGPDSGGTTSDRSQLFTSFGAQHTSVGLSIDGTFHVAKGAILDLRSGDFFNSGGVFAGKYAGSGGGTVLIGSSMQMASSDWNFETGMLTWGAADETGPTRLIGNWSNSGDLTLPASGKQIRSLRYGTLTNRGTVNFGTGAQLYLNEDFQPGNANFINTPKGIVTFAGGNQIRGYGTNSLSDLFNPNYGGSVVNAGTIHVNGGTYLNAIFDNNAGTIDAGNQANVAVGLYRGVNPGIESNSLAGNWYVHDGATITFPNINQANSQPAVVTFRGKAVIDGAKSSLPWLGTLATNIGDITVANGALLKLAPTPDDTGAGTLKNAGHLTVDAGTVSISGAFNQTAFGTLTTGVTANAVQVGGVATLDGAFVAVPPAGFVPPDGFTVDVLTAKSVVGTFASQNLGGLVSRITATTVSLNPLTDATDLALSDVHLLPGDGDYAPGTPLSVQFTVRNLSGKAVTSDWNDALYLSVDSRLDSSDMQLVRFADVGGIPAYGSRTLTVPFVAPAIPGAYSIIAVADSTVSLADPNHSNNVAVATGAIRVSAPELPLGQNVTASFAVGDTTYYQLTMPSDHHPVRLTATGAAVRLATRFALPPTDEVADATAEGTTVKLDLPSTQAGVYFVAVTRLSSGNVTLRADVTSLAVTGLGDEANLSGIVRVGDTLTLSIIGTGFTSDTLFHLGNTVALTAEVRSPTLAVVSFPVLAAGGPLYVSASNGGSTTTYTGKGFSAVASDSTAVEYDKLANWEIQVNLPRTVRILRDVSTIITFRNDSATTQPAPLIQLFTDNGTLALPGGGFVGESLMVLGVKADGRADSYAPGETGSFEVVLRPTDIGAHIQSGVYALSVGEWGFQPIGSPDPRAGTRTSVPLPSGFLDNLQPQGMPTEAWQAVRANLQTLVGSTTKSYADALRSAANILASDGAETHDLGRLNQYLVNLANQFGQISGRYRLTAFGRGIENPYDVRATVDAKGVVTVLHGLSQRGFDPTSNGFITNLPGDRGVLTPRIGGGYLLTEADGSFTAFRPDGLLDFVQDTIGRKTMAGYDSENRLSTLTSPNGDVTTLTYSASGRIATITDPVGRVTTYGFDSTGERLVSVVTPAGSTTYTYTTETTGPTAFAITGITGPGGVTTQFEYDTFGRLVRRTTGGLLPTTYSYGNDALLGTVTSTDPLGISTTLTYGEFGQITAASTASISANAQFDTAGQLSGLGGVRISRDVNGNPISAVDPSGNQTVFNYDSAGVRATAIRDPRGNTTTMNDNAFGQLVSMTYPDGTTSSFAYDANGNPKAVTSPAGRSTRTTYNTAGLPTRRDYADGTATTYTYDAHRNLKVVSDIPAGGGTARTTTLSYDAADRLISVTDPNGRLLTYTYDAAGRRIQLATSDGLTVGYGYDTLGRLSTISRNGTVQVTYTYNSAGRQTDTTYANGASDHTSYDPSGRVSRINHVGPDGSILDFQAYAYDTAGRVASITSPIGVTSYAYDAAGQLIKVTPPSGPSMTYAYDAAGNRIGTTTNERNQLLTGMDGTTYQYDADGNTLSMTSALGTSQTQYAYDARGRLVYQNGPAGTFQYEYDPLGNRSAVIKNGVRTDLLLDPTGGADGLSDVLAEYSGSTQTASYLTGLGLAARYDATGVASFFHLDAEGNTMELTSTNGAVTAQYQYGAFGEPVSATGVAATLNPYRFGGGLGVADRGSGLLEMRSRFYDSASGRFTQQDPLGFGGGDGNLYRYALNNPVMASDPSGNTFLWQGAWWGGAELAELGIDTTGLLTEEGYMAALEKRLTQGAIDSLVTSANNAVQTVAARTAAQAAASAPAAIAPAAPAVVAPVATAPAAAAPSITVSLGSTAPATLTVGSFIGGVVLPLVVTGGAVIYTAKTLQDAGFAEGNKPGPEPVASPEWNQRFQNNYENDPLYQFTLSHIANDPKHPTLEEKLRAARLINDYRNHVVRKYTDQVTAHDPNDIVGPAGTGPQGFVQPLGEFPYTIHFQNESTATASAQVVTVTQQLDSDFDWNSFTLKSFGWAGYEFSVPSGLQSYHTRVNDPNRNAIVDVNANFNAVTGKLTWTFTTLDPVTTDQPLDSVTAGFLPPDDGNGLGDGFVRYTISPKAIATTGTLYDAKATIVFDSEAPLDTPAIFNTADSGSPIVTVNALPANTPTSKVSVSWTGADDPNGSGVAIYDVYASVNGGKWTPWISDTTLTSAVYAGSAGQTVSFYAVNSDNVGLDSAIPAMGQATTTLGSLMNNPNLVGFREFAVGADGSVKTYNPDGTARFTLTPFPGFTGTLRTSSGDFNGDGIADLAVGMGPGSATQVKIFDGVTQVELFSIDPFESSFTGGVFVAAGDLNGDGKADLAITPDEGGGPRVRVFNGNGYVQIADFFGIEDTNFRGGARASIGDINGDGMGDLVIAAGFGGGPRVAAFDGSRLTSNGGPKLFGDFFAFETTLRNGIYVAVGDVNGDGFSDIVAGGGPGGGPRVFVIDGKSLVQNGSGQLVTDANFFAGDVNRRSGIRVAVKNLDDDNKSDVLTGASTNAGHQVSAYLGKDLTPLGGTPAAALEFTPFADFNGGVFVG